jgi:signal transduction histidine kinase
MKPTLQAGVYALISFGLLAGLFALYLRDDHASHWSQVESRLDFLLGESIIAVDVLFQERRIFATSGPSRMDLSTGYNAGRCKPEQDGIAPLGSASSPTDVYLGRAQLVSENPLGIVAPTYFRMPVGAPSVLCIDLSRILTWWNSMEWPEGAAVALIRDERELLIRLPFSAALLNRDIGAGPLVQAIRDSGNAAGQAEFNATNTDNVRRRVAWRSSESANLILAVGFAVDAIDDQWWAETSGLVYSLSLVAALTSLSVFGLTHIRLRSREALTLSEARLRAATDAGKMGVWEYDTDTGTLVWDAAMFSLYQVDPSEFSGVYEAWRSRVHPDDLGLTEARLNETVTRGVPFETAFRVCLPDGSIHTIRAEAKRIASEDGGGGGRVIGVNHDITEEVAARRELEKARNEAEAANRAKSEFLAAMSHELRTPLNALSGFSEMLRREAFGPLGHPKYAEYAEHMTSSASHLASLVTNVLDLSRIEAGQLEIAAAPIDLHAVMEECTHLVGYRTTRSAEDVAIEISGAGALHTDKRALRQVLINLLSNADKYTPEDGLITLSAGTAPDGTTTICIRDTGIGIAQEDIQRVMEPFGQERTDVTVTHEGTGLGLSLSAKLMALLGGSLTLESEIGHGTTVTLRFPKEPPTEPADTPNA